MIEAGRKIKAKHKMDLCDIAAISVCTQDYYQKIRSSFAITNIKHVDEVNSMTPRRLDGTDALNAMGKIFNH